MKNKSLYEVKKKSVQVISIGNRECANKAWFVCQAIDAGLDTTDNKVYAQAFESMAASVVKVGTAHFFPVKMLVEYKGYVAGIMNANAKKKEKTSARKMKSRIMPVKALTEIEEQVLKAERELQATRVLIETVRNAA